MVDYRDHKGRPFDPTTRRRPPHLGTITGERYRKAGLTAHAEHLAKLERAKMEARQGILGLISFVAWSCIGTACVLALVAILRGLQP